MEAKQETLLDHALAYARSGLPVFPVNIHKKPRTEHGLDDATRDERAIRRWWARWPDAGIGIPTGTSSGLWVLDIDGEVGADSLEAWIRANGQLPDTAAARTGSGGRHLFWKMPDDGRDIRNSASRYLGRGVDVRGTGGYVVVPPSPHELGARYAWMIDIEDAVQAPAVLVAYVRGERQEAAPQKPSSPPRRPTAYAAKALRNEAAKVAAAAPGGRNATLNAAAFALGRLVAAGNIGREQVEDALAEAAAECGLMAEDALGTHRTIRSGLDAGIRKADIPEAPPSGRPTGAAAVLAEARAGAAGESAPPPPAGAPEGASGDGGGTPGGSGSDGGGGWRSRLLLTGKGEVRSTEGNALLMIEGMLGEVLAYNEAASRSEFLAPAPWDSPERHVPRALADEDGLRCSEWLAFQTGVAFRAHDLGRGMVTAAKVRAHNPVTSYLEGLRWDEKRRLDTWLADYAGAERTALTGAFGAKWMISAVARAIRPGIKVDTVLVLESAQGFGKSSAFAVLGGDFYTDDMPELGTKDAAICAQGAWIIELGELSAMQRADVEKVKSFVSRRVDRYRPPFGTHAAEFPRRCVFAATTNEAEYLKDATGNRRFWPVRCVGRVLLEALRRDRDQLWAEAVHRYRGGEEWWISAGTSLEAQAVEEQELRQQVDPWLSVIDQWSDGRDRVTVADVLEDALRIKPERWGQAEQNRVARCLRSLGRDRQQVRVGGRRTWVYVYNDSSNLAEGVTSVTT